AQLAHQVAEGAGVAFERARGEPFLLARLGPRVGDLGERAADWRGKANGMRALSAAQLGRERAQRFGVHVFRGDAELRRAGSCVVERRVRPGAKRRVNLFALATATSSDDA